MLKLLKIETEEEIQKRERERQAQQKGVKASEDLEDQVKPGVFCRRCLKRRIIEPLRENISPGLSIVTLLWKGLKNPVAVHIFLF